MKLQYLKTGRRGGASKGDQKGEAREAERKPRDCP